MGQMPSIALIALLQSDRQLCSGASFELVNPAVDSEIVALDDGWAVEVSAGRSLVVARGGTDTDYAAALRNGIANAQRGLDLLSVKGRNHLLIKSFSNEHLVWWIDSGILVLRLLSISRMGFAATASVLVTDPAGNPLPPAPVPASIWHESFRYIRLSQTTDDLFDAYRNAFLALESVLSDIAPQFTDAAGRVIEGEGAWFRRALSAGAQLVDYTSFVPTGTSDMVDHLWNEFYRDMRTAVSHAKSGRPTFLPQDDAERDAVKESLVRLVRFWYALAEAHLNVRPKGGGLASAGFRMIAESLLSGLRVFVSDDKSELREDDVLMNPGGGSLVELSSTSTVQVEGFLATKIWSSNSLSLESLPYIRRVVGGPDPQNAHIVCRFAGDLILGSIARFQAVLGVQVSNVGQPRDHYSY